VAQARDEISSKTHHLSGMSAAVITTTIRCPADPDSPSPAPTLAAGLPPPRAPPEPAPLPLCAA
jgi:hypothetical protein